MWSFSRHYGVPTLHRTARDPTLCLFTFSRTKTVTYAKSLVIRSHGISIDRRTKDVCDVSVPFLIRVCPHVPQHTNAYGQAEESNSDVPGLLAGLEDGLGVALSRGEAIRPTFTFEPGAQTPRR